MDGRIKKDEPAISELLLTKLVFWFFGKSIYRKFAERLPLHESENVLDFGCGMGTVAFYAAKRLPDGVLVCADISQRWLKACKKTLRRYANISYVHYKKDASELGEETYDILYCHFVLHDIPEAELMILIPAFAAYLKIGGMFIFREPMSAPDKLHKIKLSAEQNGLSLESSRITDVPIMGTTIESMYIKR